MNRFIFSVFHFKKETKLSDDELCEIIQRPLDHITIPVSIFSLDIAPFETLCNYLKERFDFSITEIANVTKRSPKSVWTTLNNSKGDYRWNEEGMPVPLTIFCQRRTSVLESLCVYLREEGLGFTEIGRMIDKSPKTVWTVVQRAKRKNE